jgi:hypothetical protein
VSAAPTRAGAITASHPIFGVRSRRAAHNANAAAMSGDESTSERRSNAIPAEV